MALAVVEADGLDAREALERPGEADGGILPAGEQDEAVSGSKPTRFNPISAIRNRRSRRGGRRGARARAISAISASVSAKSKIAKFSDKPLDLAGARDDGDALLHQPAQAHLRGGLAVRLADAREHRVVLGALPRAIGL